MGPAPFLQLLRFDRRRCYNDGHHPLTPLLIVDADDRRFTDRIVTEEDVLYLQGRNLLPARFEDVDR